MSPLVLLLSVLVLLTACSPGSPVNSGPSDSQVFKVASEGSAQPTIYYHPIYYTKDYQGQPLTDMFDVNGKSLEKLPVTVIQQCATEGSCSVVNDGKVMHHYGIKRVTPPRFYLKPATPCPFGYGTQDSCADPFFSVAADLRYHHVGDVLFIPHLKNVTLPTGEVHDGYVIVRDDLGSAGANRLDFFTGFYAVRDSGNIFSKLGLGDPASSFAFSTPDAQTAAKIRISRGYPGLTTAVQQRGLDEIVSLSNR